MSRIQKIKENIEYIIVDEVSMVNSKLWSLLYQVYRECNVIFLLVGDWKQIEPVEPDVKPFNYLEHPAVLSLSKNTIINLEVVYRYDNKLKEISKDVDSIKIKDFSNKITKHNLCYTNKKRKEINNIVMDMVNKNNKEDIYYIPKFKLHKKKEEKEKDFIIRNNTSKYQDIYISKGMPVISCITKEGGAVAVNNEEFIIHDINKEKIELITQRPDGEHKIEMSITEFRRDFLLSYAITIHKSQGTTIDNKLTIWEWDKQSKKLKYTAITRATKYENINLMGDENLGSIDNKKTYKYKSVVITAQKENTEKKTPIEKKKPKEKRNLKIRKFKKDGVIIERKIIS